MSVYERDDPHFFRLALDSIFKQCLLPNEIVLVKDGPISEDLENVINDFKSSTKDVFVFKVVSSDVNVGLGIALNMGLPHCSCEYIVRMDSDDISLPDRLLEMKDFILDNPGYSVYGSQILEFIENDNNIFGIRKVKLNNNDIYTDLQYRNPINHVSVVIRRKDLVLAGGYQNFLFFEDYHLWVRMMLKGMRFLNHPNIHVKVRVGRDMIGRRHGWFYLKQELRFQRFLLDTNSIGKLIFLRNIFFRVLPRLIPKRILKVFYKLTRD